MFNDDPYGNRAARGAYADSRPPVATGIVQGNQAIAILPPHETPAVQDQLVKQLQASMQRRARGK